MFALMLLIRLMQFIIGVLVFLVVSVSATLFLAPHWAALEPEARAIDRTLLFASSLQRRDVRCSLADVWTAVDMEKLFRETKRILKASKMMRSEGDFVQKSTPAGSFWIPAADGTTLAEELAEQEFGVYGHRVRPGDVVLDCGANVGVYTKVALAEGARLVVAIEPAPKTLICLRRNLEREIREGKVIVYPKGVWDEPATLHLSTSAKKASAANSVALNRGEIGPEVPLTTIDILAAELNLPTVDLIKMDIEGAEGHALAGAARTLAAYKPRLAISMEHKTSDPDELPALVQRLNPKYKLLCTECGFRTGRIQPEMLFAQ